MGSAAGRKWLQFCALYLAALGQGCLRRGKLATGERFLAKPVHPKRMTDHRARDAGLRSLRPAKIMPRAYHRFLMGQRVIACAFAVPPGTLGNHRRVAMSARPRNSWDRPAQFCTRHGSRRICRRVTDISRVKAFTGAPSWGRFRAGHLKDRGLAQRPDRTRVE
jgi:hypothetical protein